ncbi:Hypoxic response protein 1 [Variovorax sp. PBS-H4]|uniref:CBS domain-containing protein n=1 Tax=Variovorax sp. PBS-H4 TaxID=434008 RepID=UPI001317E2B3|nr:CBS domain-containing protein [Variovorax sp. PBS-H4]VTU41228.1 Hypoxic response protein 1 [Variovorax sp. PBS-H4]
MSTVSDHMTRGVRAMSPRDTAQAAAQVMAELDVAVIPVCDAGRLVGMVSDRDITVRGVARGLPPAHTRLGYLMSAELLSCYEDESIDDVVERMRHARVRRLPVVDRRRRLVGMLLLGEQSELHAWPP